jgi:hypothetical protein
VLRPRQGTAVLRPRPGTAVLRLRQGTAVLRPRPGTAVLRPHRDYSAKNCNNETMKISGAETVPE